MSDFATRCHNLKREVSKLLKTDLKTLKERKKRAHYKELTDSLCAIATATLLTEADLEKSRKFYSQAAVNWLHYLLESNNMGITTPTYGNLGVHCAIATNNWNLAKEIAQKTSVSKTRWEYDDDFLLSQLFCTYFLNRNNLNNVKEQCLTMCTDIETYLEKTTPMTLFYRSFFEDTDKRSTAFIQWHDDIATKFQYRNEKSLHSNTSRIIDSIWLEGVSIMKIELIYDSTFLNRSLKHIPQILFTESSSRYT